MKKSLEDFVHKSGQWVGRLKQSKLQTGKPKGSLKRWEKHPFVEGLVYSGFSSEYGERWVIPKQEISIKKNEKKRYGETSIRKRKYSQKQETHSNNSTHNKKSLDEFVYQSGKSVGRLMQNKLQTGNPKGTFKRWDEHPFVNRLVFNMWNSKRGEMWAKIEDLENWERNKKAYLEIPSVKAKKNHHDREYRLLNLAKVRKNQRKYLQKIQHIYDWRKSDQGKAEIARAKKLTGNRISKKWLEKEGNRELHNLRCRAWEDAHIEEIAQYRINYRNVKRKERTDTLIQFYQSHDIPDYLWHKDEFANESDFQAALEHVISNRLGLGIERWAYLEEFGIPDIYIPSLDLIVEVKLLSSIWSRPSRLDGVAQQSLRYSEISPTVIVSLDGEPKNWADKKEVSPWFTPEQLFDFLEERRANLDYE